MNGDLGSSSSVQKGYSGSGMTWGNEMNYGMNHSLQAGSIAESVYLQPSALINVPRLPLFYSDNTNINTNSLNMVTFSSFLNCIITSCPSYTFYSIIKSKVASVAQW